MNVRNEMRPVRIEQREMSAYAHFTDDNIGRCPAEVRYGASHDQRLKE